MTSLAGGPPHFTTTGERHPPAPLQHHGHHHTAPHHPPYLHHNYTTEMFRGGGGPVEDDSLPKDQFFNEIIPTMLEDEPYPESIMEKKEREIMNTNRVKLTDYIHDATVLFPHMKQHGIFSVYDCDVIKGIYMLHVCVCACTLNVVAVAAFHFKNAIINNVFWTVQCSFKWNAVPPLARHEDIQLFMCIYVIEIGNAVHLC